MRCTLLPDVEGVCFSIDAAGVPLLNPAATPAGEIDGSSARLLRFEPWPQQFRGSFVQALLFRFFLLAERSAVQLGDPYVRFHSFTAVDSLSMLQRIASFSSPPMPVCSRWQHFSCHGYASPGLVALLGVAGGTSPSL